MTIRKISIGSTVMFTVCGLATAASADTVLTAAFPMVEYRATNGANTAGSLAAASSMGAKGFSNTVPAAGFEGTIISACHAETALLSQALQNSGGGPSLWPSACNPQGMANALNHDPNTHPTPDWVMRQWAGTVAGGPSDPGFISAFSIILNSFQVHHSPVVLPLWGSADHFATLVQLNLWDTGANIGAIKTVKWWDAGPPTTDLAESYDAAGNEYTYAGQLPVSYTSTAFANTYYKVLSAINLSCDPNCTNDPYFHQYVLLYEPPGGVIETPPPAVLVGPPGIVPPHQNLMNPQLAQTRVFDALVLAGIDQDQPTWNAISSAIPGGAYEVHARLPSGLPWNYYLIPMQTRADAVVGFIQLSTDDGSFQTIYPFAQQVPFSPVSPAKAQTLARDQVAANERLGAGVLTWNPLDVAGFAKSPIRPYYEFPVTSAANPTKVIAKIRVALDAGMVTRTR